MKKANDLKVTLLDLFRSGATEEHDVTDMEGLLDGIDFAALLQSLHHNAETVYEYTLDSWCGPQMNYRGAKLFPEKATFLCEDVRAMTFDETEISRSYELWMLPDLQLAVISCFRMILPGGQITEYRCLKEGNWQEAGMCPDFVDLAITLDEFCAEYATLEYPVYEL